MKKTRFYRNVWPGSWKITILFLFSFSGFSQNEKGLLNIVNYTPKEYGAHAQNLCIAQDPRGVMYFGNNRGVLEFDGAYWNLYKVSNETSVSSLGVNHKGRVYAGADSELGYLSPIAGGKLEYRSLVSKIPEEHRDFGRVKRIHCTNEGVIFQSGSHILLFDEQKETFRVWETESEYHLSFHLDSTVYVKEKGQGIKVFRKGQFRPLADSDRFKDQNIYDIARFKGNLLISTNDSGLYELKGSRFMRIHPPVSNIYNGVSLLDKYYSMGLFGDGILVFNKDFKEEFHIDMNTGLEDGTINFQFVDNENNLWLALNKGIAKIELVTPVTLHNFTTGLKGVIEGVTRHKGTLYVATQNGVFYLDKYFKGIQQFKQVDNLNLDCYGLESVTIGKDTMLLVAGVDGIYEVKNNKASKLVPGAPWAMRQSRNYSNRVIIGQDYGLSSIVYKDGKWVEEVEQMKGLEDQIYNFVEESSGKIWMGSLLNGVYLVEDGAFTKDEPKVKHYHKEHGLPEGPVYIYKTSKGDLFFGTDKGIYEFDPAKEKFTVSGKVKLPNTGGLVGVHRIAEDPSGRLWLSIFYDENHYDLIFEREGEGAWYNKPFLRFNNSIIQSIFFDQDGIAWAGSASGLLRYDGNYEKDYNRNFKVLIRKVMSSGKPVFEGSFYDKDSNVVADQGSFMNFEFDYSGNNLTIDFSALSYLDEKATQYSFILEGQDKNWSPWSTTPTAIFTNVSEGDYQFKVKAKNIFGVESEETVFAFTIFPPWYRTTWAYIGYFILFVAFVWGAVAVSTRSLKNIIQERTAEIVHQKEEIEKQKEIVEEKNKDILDSIKYAKRIQDAIMPSEDRMKDMTGKDLFVLFKPKDIVSGDFYWMRIKGSKVLFAAVDCTGHGVPGAFVSIVGNNGLNRAVNEFGLTTPAQILDNLTITVEDAFKQQGASEVRDGMDISLCSLETISFNESKLEWAGANNPLWIIRKKDPTVIEEYKADKQPIGKFESRKPFTPHDFNLEKGDTVYIFSDGYADQFGGENGKKFKYSKLKELLISMFNSTMDEQRIALDKAFEEWKRDHEQIDDVCVIGVRI